MDGDEGRPATARTLAEVLRTDPPAVGEAVRLAAAVADEVAALHAAGRAHGALGIDAVRVADDGEVALTGGPAARGRPAAPLEVRLADVRAVGRILALSLGTAGPTDALPDPIEDLVATAEAADAPAFTLALALQRLAHDPAAAVRLLPAPVPAAQRSAAADGLLAGLIPRAERRVTGVAAVVVGGATAIGLALLLGGAPASSTSAPQPTERTLAAGAAAPAAAPPALTAGVSASASDDHVSAQDVLAPRPRSTLAAVQQVLAPAPATSPEVSVSAPEAPAPPAPGSTAPAAPAAPPTSDPTGTPAPGPVETSTPAPTAEPTGTPTTAPTEDPAPSTAPPAPAPTTAPTATAPAPTAAATATAATAAPTAVAAQG